MVVVYVVSKCIRTILSTVVHVHLYHDAWADKKYCHSIYLPYTLARCMVARTTNALADNCLHWLIESWYKSVYVIEAHCYVVIQ